MNRADEDILVSRAKLGDGSAIASLIQHHQEALYSFMLRLSGRPDVAEDIVQEAFVRVLKNIDRFDSRFRFSTWLFTIAKRLHMNAMQKHKPVYDTDHVGAQTGGYDAPGFKSANDEMMDNVRLLLDAALNGLSEQQREIVLLFHQQNWPIADIAIYMKMPEGTVKSHLHRARQRMKRFIESHETYMDHASEVWT
jgi:RNA polymerase sigma-70 factor, ECF subfamily